MMATTDEPCPAATTRSVVVNLSEKDSQRLDERARRDGIDRAECAGRLLRSALELTSAAEEKPRARKTLDEIFAPVHREFAESGMTEEELYEQLEEAREEVWQETQQADSEAAPSLEGDLKK